MLIERLAGEVFDLLADAAADQAAERVADAAHAGTDRAGEGAERLELALQRRGDDENAGLAGDLDRPPIHGEVQLRVGKKLRHRILRLAGELPRRLRVERLRDG